MNANESSHLVFLVLDHNEPNPLFHAPIGDNVKVRGEKKMQNREFLA